MRVPHSCRVARKIFYSWQSDLASATNRALILDASRAACAALAEELSVEERPEVDHDTRGVPGAPDIVHTIFAKIDAADVFVADVSIVTGDAQTRMSPNPNVLIELGYAIKALGWERIVLVMNSVYGAPESLPFDLRTKRTMTYQAKPEETDRAGPRRRLAAALRSAFATILESAASTSERDRSASERRVRERLALMRTETDRMHRHATDLNASIGREHFASYLPLLLRPQRLIDLRFELAAHLPVESGLLDDLDQLEGAASAVDREAERLLGGSGEGARLRPLLRQVLSSSRAVSAGIERILSRPENAGAIRGSR